METVVSGITVKMTVSIGVTSFEPGMKEVTKSQLIHAADEALYQAKKNGRNRTVAKEITV
jgi:diguanylate cyclase (GGDEF)-like protein